MCDKNESERYIGRLQDILNAVRLQNSGADIHTVGNIRNCCILLINQLEEYPEDIHIDQVVQIIHNQEEKLVEFYQTKYYGIKIKSDC